MNTNSQKAKSLSSRIFLTFGVLSIVRLGSFISLPDLDRATFASLLQGDSSSFNTFAQVLNTFSGSNKNSFGLLSLGILPYINASILVQLITKLVPSLSQLQKEEGEYGRRKLTDYVRYFTFFWAIIESFSLTYNLRPLIFDWSFWTAIQISLILISGCMIVLWFSEVITKNGLGNGASLLICFNIVSSFPEQIKTFIFSLKNQPNATSSTFFLIVIFFLTTFGCIYINEAVVKIPLISARQLLKKSKTKTMGTTTLPLKLNQAGVMPLVFTSYTMVLLSAFVSLLKNQLNFFLGNFTVFTNLNENIFFWGTKLIFWFVYAGLIFFFTYFYSTVVLDPKDVAEQLRKNSVVILGIPPGSATKTYLKKTLRRIARINAIFLISNIVGLQIIEVLFGLNLIGLKGLGFTSQLILVNVLIDTLKRIKSFFNETNKNML